MLNRSLALVVCAAASFSAASAVTIDSFSTAQSLTISAGAPSAANLPGNVATGADAVGGTRTIILSRTSGIGQAVAAVDSVSLPGAFQLNTDAMTTAAVEFIWDGGADFTLDNPGFTTTVDFTDGGLSDRIRMAIIDADLGFSMTLRLYTDVPGSYHEWAFSPASGPSTVDLLFSTALSVGGATDFNAVRAVQLLIEPASAGDLAIDFITSTSDTPGDPGVPEPSTFVLAGIGLLAAGLIRRNRS
ncbi:MAG: PEP-CTERM sorting domain-containing protein [Bryobacteraceae bacterium]|nr:PEP-CTERM sorting domain-containing protein [Bryobacteraceae bacterium]